MSINLFSKSPIFGKKISNFLSNFRPDFCPKISNSGPIFENGVAYKKKGVLPGKFSTMPYYSVCPLIRYPRVFKKLVELLEYGLLG